MTRSYDPWENPEFLPPRRKRSHQAWRAGRTRVLRALLVIAGLYALYTLIGGDQGLLQIRNLDRQEQKIREEISATETRIEAFDHKLEDLAHTIEEKARKNGYIGPNEWVYEAVPSDSVAVMPPVEAPGAAIGGGRAGDGPGGPDEPEAERETAGPAGSEGP